MSRRRDSIGLMLVKYMFTVVLLLGLSPVLAGQWIVPDPPDMLAVGFGSATLSGKSVDQTPFIYRTVVKSPPGSDLACVALRSSGYAYIWVDGVCVSGRDVDAADRESQRAARNRILSADLTQQLCDGKEHVLAVSAPKDGFVMDGAFFKEFERLGDIASSDSWTVTRFAPATALEEATVMQLDYDGRAVKRKYSDAWPVREISSYNASDESFISTAQQLRCRRIYNRCAEICKRLATFVESGDIVSDSVRSRWSGLVNTDSDTLRRAQYKLKQAVELKSRIKMILARVNRPDTDRTALTGELGEFSEQLDAFDNWLEQIRLQRESKHGAILASLASKTYGKLSLGKGGIDKLPDSLKVSPLKLNRSEDIFGWFELTDTFDGDISNWGIRINPVSKADAAKKISLAGNWRFQCDITDVGMEVGAPRGARMDQWLIRTIPHNWARDIESGISLYEGLAWYARKVKIPAQWAGLPVRFKFTVEGDERLWVNGREVSALGSGFRKRTYDLPPETLCYGSENLIVVQVLGQGANRGLAGQADISCPRLLGWASNDTPQVDIASSALSPMVMLRPHTDKFMIRHSGKAAMAIPQDGTVKAIRQYDRVQNRKLSENWILLWMHPRNPWDVLRPVLLVFQHNPRLVTCREGLIEIVLHSKDELVVAVRPWSKLDTSANSDSINLLQTVQRWSHLARAIPINFAALPAAASEGHRATTLVYDYHYSTDDWDTEPLKIAPLPAMAAAALASDGDFLSVENAENLANLHEGWRFGPYMAAVNTSRVTYSFEDNFDKTYRAVQCDFAPRGEIDSYCQLAKSLGFNTLNWVYRYDAEKGKFGNFKPSGGPWPAEIAKQLDMFYIHSLGQLETKAGQRLDPVAVRTYMNSLGKNIQSASEAIEAVDTKAVFSLDLPSSNDDSDDVIKQLFSTLSKENQLRDFIVKGSNNSVYDGQVCRMKKTSLDISSTLVYGQNDDEFSGYDDCSGYLKSVSGDISAAASAGKSLFVDILSNFDKDDSLDVKLLELIDIFDSLGMSWSVADMRLLVDIRADGSLKHELAATTLYNNVLRWHTE